MKSRVLGAVRAVLGVALIVIDQQVGGGWVTPFGRLSVMAVAGLALLVVGLGAAVEDPAPRARVRKVRRAPSGRPAHR